MTPEQLARSIWVRATWRECYRRAQQLGNQRECGRGSVTRRAAESTGQDVAGEVG